MTSSPDITRRAALAGVGLAAAPALAVAEAADPSSFVRPTPLPRPAPATEGFVEVPGARLWYWDTGGVGPPLVLAHAATGSGLVWGYQQPVFAAAGYRVIGWSRRNHARSVSTDPSLPTDVDVREIDDLKALADRLGLDRFHALGTAAGGGVMLRFAVANPERVRTLVMACSLGDIRDKDYADKVASLRPPGFGALPPEFRELGPAYRAGDPEGAARWLELETQARTARPGTGPGGYIAAEQLGAIRAPSLWLTGDADLFLPPPLLGLFLGRVRGAESAVIDGAGHSAYWEQPATFNRLVLDFLRRRG